MPTASAAAAQRSSAAATAKAAFADVWTGFTAPSPVSPGPNTWSDYSFVARQTSECRVLRIRQRTAGRKRNRAARATAGASPPSRPERRRARPRVGHGGRLEVAPVHERDVAHGDLFRADRLALGLVGAVAEAFGVHALDHAAGAALVLDPPLR